MNKKGFTLIELLATIVILGLLALIVTPGIAKVIRNSKINTAKASIEGYVREIENASALYLTDTGKYPSSIDVLEIDGKNIDKIKNPSVTLENGLVSKVTAEIDGLYCSYEIGKDTVCSLEEIVEYAYLKNPRNLNSISEKFGLSLDCFEFGVCTEDEQEIKSDPEKLSEFQNLIMNELSYFYGISIDKIKSIEFTDILPEGERIDVSKDENGDIYLYYNSENSIYDVKIYSDKKIIFPEDSSYMFTALAFLEKLKLGNIINTGNVVNMSSMFGSVGVASDSFELDLGNEFNTSNVTNMKGMFSGASVLSLDLSSFDTRNVTDMSYMFNGFYNLKTIYVSDKWNTDNVTDSENMFDGCTSLPNFDANVIDKTNAYYGEGGYLTLKTN